MDVIAVPAEVTREVSGLRTAASDLDGLSGSYATAVPDDLLE